MGFLHSQAMGTKGEKFVQVLFRGFGIDCTLHDDAKKNIDYDLKCKIWSETKKSGKGFTCEVKYDNMAEKTGNVAIEYYNSKSCKPSGLDATKAKVWIHLVPDGRNVTAWGAPVKGLKEYVKRVLPKKNLTGVGDDNACIYLYDCDVILKEAFVRLDNINEQDLKAAIRRLIK